MALRATNEILAKAVESNAERLWKRYLLALKTTYSSVTRMLALFQSVRLPDNPALERISELIAGLTSAVPNIKLPSTLFLMRTHGGHKMKTLG